MGKALSRINSSHVPGQLLGFSLQVTRFLSRLITAPPGSFVSLEVFDDVGIEYPGGSRTGEQDKSITGDGNPIANRSVDLWKTFGIWVDAAHTGELPPNNSIYTIYISRPLSGDIANKFSAANSIEESKVVLLQAQKEFWGNAPDYPNKVNVSPTLAPYLEKVLLADEAIICNIIKNFNLELGSGSPQNDLRRIIEENLFVPPEIVDDLVIYLQGWVKKELDIKLEQKKPAIIERDNFKNETISYIRKHDNRAILNNFAQSPKPEEIQAGLLQTYIRQLELIECAPEQKICAINDYICASINRVEWVRKGIVNRESFDELEERLRRTWKNTQSKTNIQLSNKNDIEKGTYLYSECSNYQTDLEGLSVPPPFIPGSFHALADTLEIGWHPKYKNILLKKSKDKTS